MTKKILKRTVIIFFMIFLCTLASAKGKGDFEQLSETSLELTEESEIPEEEPEAPIQEKEEKPVVYEEMSLFDDILNFEDDKKE